MVTVCGCEGHFIGLVCYLLYTCRPDHKICMFGFKVDCRLLYWG